MSARPPARTFSRRTTPIILKTLGVDGFDHSSSCPAKVRNVSRRGAPKTRARGGVARWETTAARTMDASRWSGAPAIRLACTGIGRGELAVGGAPDAGNAAALPLKLRTPKMVPG